MKKTKEILILGIILIIVCGLVMPVKAVEEQKSSFKSEVTVDKNTIKPGDTVDVTVSVKDLNMGEKGINTLEGTLSYDKDLFEDVKSSDIKSVNNWSTTFNDESSALNGKFLAATLTQGLKDDSKIFTITFKSKKDIEETTSTKIEFKDLTSNDGNNLVNSGTKSVDVKIEVEKKVTPPVDDGNKTDGNNTSGSTSNENKTSGNTGTNVKKNTSQQSGNSTTKSNTRLPKTGKTDFVIFALIVVVILLIIFGIKTRNMRGI